MCGVLNLFRIVGHVRVASPEFREHFVACGLLVASVCVREHGSVLRVFRLRCHMTADLQAWLGDHTREAVVQKLVRAIKVLFAAQTPVASEARWGQTPRSAAGLALLLVVHNIGRRALQDGFVKPRRKVPVAENADPDRELSFAEIQNRRLTALRGQWDNPVTLAKYLLLVVGALVVNKLACFAFRVLSEARFSRASHVYARVSVLSEHPRVWRVYFECLGQKASVSAIVLQSVYLYAGFRVSPTEVGTDPVRHLLHQVFRHDATVYPDLQAYADRQGHCHGSPRPGTNLVQQLASGELVGSAVAPECVFRSVLCSVFAEHVFAERCVRGCVQSCVRALCFRAFRCVRAFSVRSCVRVFACSPDVFAHAL